MLNDGGEKEITEERFIGISWAKEFLVALVEQYDSKRNKISQKN